MKNNIYILMISLFMITVSVIQGSEKGSFCLQGNEYRLKFTQEFEEEIVRTIAPSFRNANRFVKSDIERALFQAFPMIQQELFSVTQQTGKPCNISTSSWEYIKTKLSQFESNRKKEESVTACNAENPFFSTFTPGEILLSTSDQVTSSDDVKKVTELLENLKLKLLN